MKVFYLILMLIFLVACDPIIEEGRIVEKKHHEEYQTVTMIPILTSNGQATTTTLLPMFQYYPESWEITISSYDNESQKELKQNFYVSENVFESVAEGDYFKFAKHMGSTTRPIEEREATQDEQESLME